MSELMSVNFNPNKYDLYTVVSTEDANPLAQQPVAVDEVGVSSKKSSSSSIWDNLQAMGNAVAVHFKAEKGEERVGFAACTIIAESIDNYVPTAGDAGVPDAGDGGPDADTGVCIDNEAPGSFGTNQPMNGSTGVSLRPTFQWSESIDPNSDTVTYSLLIDTNENFSNPVTFDASSLTQYTLADPLATDTTYYWRVVASDPCDATAESQPTPAFSFTTLADCSLNPGTFNLIDPANTSIDVEITPTFDWSDSIDLDPGDSVQYRLEISTDAQFTSPIVYSGLTDSNYTLNLAEALAYNQDYYWKVTATDDCDNEVASTSTYSFTTAEYCSNPPATFSLTSPNNLDTNVSVTPTLDWADSIDTDAGDTVEYRLEIDTVNTFPAPTVFNGIANSTYTVAPGDALNNFTEYFWRAIAIDDCNNEVASSGVYSFTTEQLCTTFSETDNWSGTLTDMDGASIGGTLILAPFVTSGNYSMVIDAGAGISGVNWQTLNYNSNIPDPGNSSLAIETRTSSDGVGWPPIWDPLGGGGSIDSTDERYLEVRFNFVVSNTSIQSPELLDYIINYCTY